MRKINENELRIVDAGEFYWGNLEGSGISVYGFFNQEKLDFFCYLKYQNDYGFAVAIRGFYLLYWDKTSDGFQLTLFNKKVIG